MKCRHCRTTMERKQVSPHKFVYECPKCHAKVGKVENDGKDTE